MPEIPENFDEARDSGLLQPRLVRRFDAIRWNENGPGWSWDNSVMKECPDGEYVLHEDLAPTLDAEELRKALWPIREAQVMLEDNHPNWNEEGQRYAIAAACEKLRDAHNRVSLLYAALIGLPNTLL
jgi:hypothetical protein